MCSVVVVVVVVIVVVAAAFRVVENLHMVLFRFRSVESDRRVLRGDLHGAHFAGSWHILVPAPRVLLKGKRQVSETIIAPQSFTTATVVFNILISDSIL